MFGIVAAALALRLGCLAVAGPRRLSFTDALVYHLQANVLADGHGFVNPVVLLWLHRSVPTAAHPPLFPLVLAVVSLLGGRSIVAHQIATCVIGAVAVGAIGVAGWRVAGERAGLAAAAVAALDPALWINDPRLMSETLFALTIAMFVVAAYRLRDRPGWRGAALLGAATGAAALVRGEAILLVLAAAAVARRPRLIATTVAATALVVAPWLVRDAVTFHRPIAFSSDSGSVVAGANCPASYHGPGTGGWSFACEGAVPSRGDESDQAVADRQAGLHYARTHTARLPAVLVARERRTWELWSAPGGQALYLFAGSALAVAGLIVLRRRGRPVLPLAALGGLVVVVTALAYGTPRWRVPWDVALAILAGVALDAWAPNGEGSRAQASKPRATTFA